MIKIFLLFVFIIITCSNKPIVVNNLSKIGFYSSPEDQIIIIEKSNIGYRESFMLGLAYKKLKNYKKAILNFANSCFINTPVKFENNLFEDIIHVIKMNRLRSEFFNDALYELADIYSLYDKSTIVLELLNLISSENKGIYLNSILLKAKIYIKLNKYDEALSFLEGSLKIYNNDSKPLIYLKIGSIYEKQKFFVKAVDTYFKILNINPHYWYSSIASKLIMEIINKKQWKIENVQDSFFLIKALYNSKQYNHALKIAEKIDYETSSYRNEFNKIYIRLLTRANNYKMIHALQRSVQNDKNLYFELFSERADEFWKMNKKDASIILHKEIIKSRIEPFSESSLKHICDYSAEVNIKNNQKYFHDYIKKYKESPSTGYYLWILAREELLKNKFNEAKSQLEESIKRYPHGIYSGQCRFWLFKILKMNNENVKAENIAKDLIKYNSDSSYSWDVLKKIESEYNIITLNTEFYNSVSKKLYDDALFYHTLIFMKNKNVETRNNRINSIDHNIIEKYDTLNKKINYETLKSEYSDIIKSIEKYFSIGNMELIERELKYITYNDHLKNLKNTILTVLGNKYNQYYLSANSMTILLKSNNLPEYIQLLPMEILYKLYPQAFKDCIQKIDNKILNDKTIIYSVMRSESLYKHTAVSRSNAIGLMQILPSTADGISKSLKKIKYNLKDPCTSLQFGSLYLSWLYKNNNSNIKLTLAGYNSGPNFIKRLFNQNKYSDLDLFIESIPMSETRYYTIRTEKNIQIYQLLYNEK